MKEADLAHLLETVHITNALRERAKCVREINELFVSGARRGDYGPVEFSLLQHLDPDLRKTLVETIAGCYEQMADRLRDVLRGRGVET